MSEFSIPDKEAYFGLLEEYGQLIRQTVPGDYELEYRNRYYMEAIRRELERVLAEEPRGARILDLGCGRGHFTAFLQLRGMEAHGVDVRMPATTFDDMFLEQDPSTLGHYPQLWQEAERRYGCKLGYFDESVLPHPDGFFDVVLFFASYEHISLDQVMPVTREAWRVLKPGGRVYVFHCPSNWSWSEHFTKWMGLTYHPKLYSKAELLGNFSQVGFKPVWFRRSDFLPSWVGPLTPYWSRMHELHLALDRLLWYTPLRLFFHFFALKAVKPAGETKG